MKKYTDTELLDFLQEMTNRRNYTGKIILRWSLTGRGWRLHETSHPDAVSDVRKAIANLMVGSYEDE